MTSSPYREASIPYAVQRSDRARYARIEVDASGVRVIVPRRMPLREVAPFVARKQRWIERTLRRYRQAEAEAPRVELVDGGSVPYLGRDLTLRVRIERGRERPHVALRGHELRVAVGAAAGPAGVRDAIERWYRRQARAPRSRRGSTPPPPAPAASTPASRFAASAPAGPAARAAGR